MTPNTLWRPIFWDPVAGTGERLMVGVLVERDGDLRAQRLIRDDVLDCLYGKHARGVRTLIETGIAGLRAMAEATSIQREMPDAFGMYSGPLRHTWAESHSEALRTAALLHSSLANLQKIDEPEETDAPSQEDTNRRFATEVKERVIEQRPDLIPYFGRQAVLIENGDPTRFGFCSARAILHFGALSPVRQSAGVRDARARLWELHRAREWANLSIAALVCATPRLDDPTLSPAQIESLRRNLAEIEREADSYKMRFHPVTSVVDGAEHVLQYA